MSGIDMSHLPLDYITSLEQLRLWISGQRTPEDASLLLVVMFTASWCGPCRSIKPWFTTRYHQLADAGENVYFVLCDVDHTPEAASSYLIESMPSFVFFKRGGAVEMVKGTNKYAVEAAIQRHLN
jgi:thioredoxin 1